MRTSPPPSRDGVQWTLKRRLIPFRAALIKLHLRQLPREQRSTSPASANPESTNCIVYNLSHLSSNPYIGKMTSTLSHPPAHLPPAVALHLSQQAPVTLRNTPSAISSYSVSSLWSAAETPELWTEYENLMLSCLRTGDEQSAGVCLERLTERFGSENERLMALRGLFQEAIAKDDAALKQVLGEYDNILTKDPSNMVGAQSRACWASANTVSPCRSAESRSSRP